MKKWIKSLFNSNEDNSAQLELSDTHDAQPGYSQYDGPLFCNVQLRPGFDRSLRIANVAVTMDGSQYALVRTDGGVLYGELENGEATVDGVQIKFGKGNGSIIVNGTVNGSIHATAYNDKQLTVIGGQTIKNKIDELYEDISSVRIKSSFGGAQICYSPSNATHVRGTLDKLPKLDDGSLKVKDLEGLVSTPASATIDVNVSSDVTGSTGSPGKIKTSFGAVNLTLTQPLRVTPKTSFGGIEVYGMVREDKKSYVPIDEAPLGTLVIKASGDVIINYKK